MQDASPSVIRRSDPRRVEIEWTDGARSILQAADLRRACPCARCVNELTGVRTHDPATVPDDLTQANLRLVGNYALSMTFSDGHHTGIFTFAFLRRLGASGGA
jgi:ATP-binding protein involved in chromosome partitioning